MLRALTLPGAESLLRIGCTPAVRDAGLAIAGWLEQYGWQPGPILNEIGRSYSSLADPATRRAFLHTLRSVVDHEGQRVSAGEKMQLSVDLPTLIIWGTHDHVIPVQHALDAHAAIGGSRIELFEGAGHFMHCEEPDRFVQVLHEFIRTSEPCEVLPSRQVGPTDAKPGPSISSEGDRHPGAGPR